MPETLVWRQAPVQDTLREAADRLARGGVVVFPTDTTYVAVASTAAPEAVERLHAVSGAAEAPALTLAVRGEADARGWVPNMSVVGRRLTRRTWPGPVTLVFPLADTDGKLAALPPAVRALLCRGDELPLRSPAHEALYHAQHAVPDPLVFACLRRPDGGYVTSAEEVAQLPDPPADLVVADGPTYFGRPAAVVEVAGERCAVRREGILSAGDVDRLAACQILFVCTGNTCRSPMAEVLCKKLLAERLGCPPDELPAHGFVVQSAGMSAFPGYPASPEAVDVLRALGADLADHRSQPLTAELLEHADHVLTMTQSHLDMLLSLGRDLPGTPRLLSRAGEDVTDPIGREAEVYGQCARQILAHLQERLPEFQPA